MHSSDILKPIVIRFVVENSREVVTQENWKEKLMTFPEVFADVFNELASQAPKKKQNEDDDLKSGSVSSRKACKVTPGQDLETLFVL